MLWVRFLCFSVFQSAARTFPFAITAFFTSFASSHVEHDDHDQHSNWTTRIFFTYFALKLTHNIIWPFTTFPFPHYLTPPSFLPCMFRYFSHFSPPFFVCFSIPQSIMALLLLRDSSASFISTFLRLFDFRWYWTLPRAPPPFPTRSAPFKLFLSWVYMVLHPSGPISCKRLFFPPADPQRVFFLLLPRQSHRPIVRLKVGHRTAVFNPFWWWGGLGGLEPRPRYQYWFFLGSVVILLASPSTYIHSLFSWFLERPARGSFLRAIHPSSLTIRPLICDRFFDSAHPSFSCLTLLS